LHRRPPLQILDGFVPQSPVICAYAGRLCTISLQTAIDSISGEEWRNGESLTSRDSPFHIVGPRQLKDLLVKAKFHYAIWFEPASNQFRTN